MKKTAIEAIKLGFRRFPHDTLESVMRGLRVSGTKEEVKEIEDNVNLKFDILVGTNNKRK